MARISNSGTASNSLRADLAAARKAKRDASRADAVKAAARRMTEIRARMTHLQVEAERLQALAAGPDSWGAVGSLGHLETVLGQLLGMEG